MRGPFFLLILAAAATGSLWAGRVEGRAGVEPSPEKRCAWAISAETLQTVRLDDPVRAGGAWLPLSNGNISELRQNNSGTDFPGVVAGAGWIC